MAKNVYFNYDIKQCNWLFKQGITPIGCGTGNKGDAFNVFIVSAKYKNACKYYDENINLTKENDTNIPKSC